MPLDAPTRADGTPTRSRAPRLRFGDGSIAALLFVATLAAAWALLARSGVSEFYEVYFSPAVNFACTGQFAELDVRTPPLKELAAFLDRKADTFDCAALPRDLAGYVRPMDVVQDATIYLIGAAALIWRWAGVSWAALVPLGAALTAMFALAVYAMSRLFVGRMLALGIVVLSLASPLHLSMMHALRDYSKAPFIVGSAFFIGAAILGRTTRGLILCATAAGGVAGVGLGFRSDAMLVVPFFTVVALAGLGLTRERPRAAFVLALGGFLIAFAVAGAAPLLAGIRHGGIAGHVALLGLTTPFNEPLGLTPTFYDIGSIYSDRAVTAFVNGFESFRHQSAASDLIFNSPAYNRVAVAAYQTYALNFPADLLVRADAAILRVLNAVGLASPLAHVPLLAKAHAAVTAIGAKPFIVLAALTLLAGYRGVAAAFLSVFIIWFAGSISIQFQPRHAFYLDFVYWLALVLLVALPVEAWRQREEARARPYRTLQSLIPLSLVTLLFVFTWGARAYQSQHVATLMARYDAAPRAPVETAQRAQNDEVLVVPTGPIPDVAGRIAPFARERHAHYYFVVRIDPAACAGPVISLTAQYRVRDELANILPTNDFTRRLDIPRAASGGAITVFVPATVGSASAFEAFRLPAGQAGCLQAVEAVTETRGLPLPLWIVMDLQARSAPRYQELSRWR